MKNVELIGINQLLAGATAGDQNADDVLTIVKFKREVGKAAAALEEVRQGIIAEYRAKLPESGEGLEEAVQPALDKLLAEESGVQLPKLPEKLVAALVKENRMTLQVAQELLELLCE